MESGDAVSQGAGHAPWVFTKARVAMAVAVIKSRPPGATSKEHCEALARRLVSQDSELRHRVLELQEEVLTLRQEVAMSRSAAVLPVVESTAQEVDATSQDLFSPDSPSTVTPPLEATPLLVFYPAPAMKTTSPSLRFLRSMCELGRVGDHQCHLEWLGSCPARETVTLVVDSVCCLLDSVVEEAAATAHTRLLPHPGLPCDLVLEACRVAAQATELLCHQRALTSQDMRRLEAPLSQLTETLLSLDQTSGVQMADKVAEQLLSLGSGCSFFKSFLSRHFLSELEGVAEQLWEAHQGQFSLELFPIRRYFNSSLLLWVLETFLRQGPLPGAPGPTHFLQRVFPLADEFPLFSICAWKVGRLLAAPDSCSL